MTTLWVLFTICIALFMYHHFIYPLLLRFVAKRQKVKHSTPNAVQTLPRVGIIMCAYNEEAYIRAKLDNLAMLDYPPTAYDIHIGLDGCTDNTEAVINSVSQDLVQKRIQCTPHVFTANQGKVKTLNYLIEKTKDQYDVLLFTDVSALLSIDALRNVAQAFQSPNVGVVSGDYQFLNPAQPEQTKYWQYQNKLKRDEGALGAVIGVPGAMFAVRAKLVKTVPENTINDDFVIPMRAIEQGYEAIVDPDLGIVELESDTSDQELKRRVRIGAGNLQQLWFLKSMLRMRNGWKAFNFFSGKAMRAVMPIIIAVGSISVVSLAALGSTFAQIATAATAGTLLVESALKHGLGIKKVPVLSSLSYLVVNYAFALVGIVKWCCGHYAKSWNNGGKRDLDYVPLSVRFGKRTIDILGSASGLLLLMPLMILTAVVVKVSSKGPVFYKQWRVGKASGSWVSLFYMYKFRTMVVNAEQNTGAVWSKNNDPRITRVGRFLRKTRIDELPQLWNVLIGDMSLIGPRPERPDFHKKLEFHIPFFSERTMNVKPGISGLAQIKEAYANDINGMRQKLAWDMAYTLSLSSPMRWIKTEITIVFATLKVMLLAKGQ